MIRLKNLLPKHLLEQEDSYSYKSKDFGDIKADPVYAVIVIRPGMTLQQVLEQVQNVDPEKKAIIFASEFVGDFPDNIATPYKSKINEMNQLVGIYEELFKQNILQEPQFKVMGIADKDPASRWIPGTKSGKADPEWKVGDPDAQLEVDRSVLGAHPHNRHTNSANYGPDIKVDDVGVVQSVNSETEQWVKENGEDANMNLASNRAGIMASQIQRTIKNADIEVKIQTGAAEKSVRFSMFGTRMPKPGKPRLDLSNVIKWNNAAFVKDAIGRNGIPQESSLARAIENGDAGQFNPGSLQFLKDAKRAGYNLDALKGLPKGWSKIDNALIDRLIRFFRVRTKEEVYKIISGNSAS